MGKRDVCLRNGSGRPGGALDALGELPTRTRRRRDRIRPTIQLVQNGPWGILNSSESQMNLRYGMSPTPARSGTALTFRCLPCGRVYRYSSPTLSRSYRICE